MRRIPLFVKEGQGEIFSRAPPVPTTPVRHTGPAHARPAQSGLAGKNGFLLSAVTLAWKMGTGSGTEGGQSPPVPVPIFMMQPLLPDDTGERASLSVRCGKTLPFFFSRRSRSTAQ